MEKGKEQTSKFFVSENGTLSLVNPKTIKRYKELSNMRNTIPLSEFKCFCAFTELSFRECIKSLRIDESEVVSLGGGLYGTKEGRERLLKYYADIRQKIKEECDPQEVYCYEYNNYECALSYDGDEEAVISVIRIFGEELTRTIDRVRGYVSVDQIIKELN